jgi:hypothetical protein
MSEKSQHLVVTKDKDGIVKVYVDGEEQKEMPEEWSISAWTYSITMVEGLYDKGRDTG